MEKTNPMTGKPATESIGVKEMQLREQAIKEIEQEDAKEFAKFDKMEEMEGQEVWTNAFSERFGERVCVGIDNGFCWNEGKKFKPTKKEINDLWNDHIENELGSPAQRKADLEKEFTPEYCAELYEESIKEKMEEIKKRGEVPKRPKYDRCNKGHVLEWDTDRKVWDCPMCIKEMQELNSKESN